MKTGAQCNECKVRAADFLCGCLSPYPLLCSSCLPQHQTHLSTFHSLLPIKYLPDLKSSQDFKRLFLRETQTQEVLEWIQTSLNQVDTLESQLQVYVAQGQEQLNEFQCRWREKLQRCREVLGKDLEEVRRKIDAKASSLDKLLIIKPLREVLISFHLPDLNLPQFLDPHTHLTLYSPSLLQEQTLTTHIEAHPTADSYDFKEIESSLNRMSENCVGLMNVMGEKPTKIEFSEDLIGKIKETEWILTESVSLVTESLQEIHILCRLLMGKDGTGSLKSKLASVLQCIAAGKDACKELPRSLRDQTVLNRLKTEVSTQSTELTRLKTDISQLQTTLSSHQNCDELRSALQTAENRLEQAESAVNSAQFQLQDNLERYCREIISQHKQKLADFCGEINSELKLKMEKDEKSFECFHGKSLEKVGEKLKKMTDLVGKMESLRSEMDRINESEMELNAVSGAFPLKEGSSEEWNAVQSMLRAASDRLRTEAGNKTALFLTQITDSTFSELEKVLIGGDTRLSGLLESLKALIESPHLIAIESWVKTCKSIIPKKKWSDLDTVMVCYNSFREELSAVFRSTYSQFGNNRSGLETVRREVMESFGKLCPALLAESIGNMNRDMEAALRQAVSTQTSEFNRLIRPVSNTLNNTKTGLVTFIKELESVTVDAQSALQNEFSECIKQLYADLKVSSEALDSSIQKSASEPVPDFPPSISIQPLPLQEQTRQLAELHVQLNRTSGDLEKLKIQHQNVSLQRYALAVEQVWQKEIRCSLTAWCARSLTSPMSTISDRGLSNLRLPFKSYPPIHTKDPVSPPQIDSFPTQTAFQYIDELLGRLYEDGRKALLSGQPLQQYSVLVQNNCEFGKAGNTMKRLYGYQQPQAIVFARLFGLFGEQGVTAEWCFVVNYYRQLFQRLAYRDSSKKQPSWPSTCCEVNLSSLLREITPRIALGGFSLPLWTALIGHLKPMDVSIKEFGWFLTRWLVMHHSSSSAGAIWSEGGKTSLREAVRTAVDGMVPEELLQVMISEDMSEQAFLSVMAPTECKFQVRGDMFLCGILAGLDALTVYHPAFSSAVVLVP